MDQLAALESFCRVAETGSFSAAARALALTQPAVSRQVALLETHYRVRLLQRSTRHVTLTEEGRLLLDHARQVLDAVDAAALAMGGQSAEIGGLVRIGSEASIGQFFASRLDRLLARHPRVQVELIVRERFGDMLEEGLDLMLHTGAVADSALVVRQLTSVPMLPVASPGYLDRHPALQHPAELAAHCCLIYRAGRSATAWHFDPRDGAGDSAAVEVAVDGPFHSDNLGAIHRAAQAGVGVAVLPVAMTQPDLAAGVLRRLLPGWVPRSLPLHAIYPSRRNLAPRVRAVLDFLVAETRPIDTNRR